MSVIFTTKGNKEISWETNTNINIGADFDFFKGRLSGSVEYFYRLTSDMLSFFYTPASIGYSGYYDNVGDMRNSGVEVALNGVVMQRRNFRWDAYLNFTHYNNRILKIADENKTRVIEGYEGYRSGSYYYGEGLPLFTYLMPSYAGVDHSTGESLWYMDVLDNEGNVIDRTTTDKLFRGHGLPLRQSYSETLRRFRHEPEFLRFRRVGFVHLFHRRARV